MTKTDNDFWFAPRRFGVGSGPPLKWQGWATIGLNGAMIAAGIPLLELQSLSSNLIGQGHFLFAGYSLAVMLVFAPLYAAKTRGGWRWRWGGE